MLKIRQAREEELLKIAELWKAFMKYNRDFNKSFEINKKAKEIFSREMIEKLEESDSHLAVAESDGELIGFCYSYISQKPKYFRLSKFGFIGDLYVIPEFRRNGVGRALVKDAVDFFNRKKIKQIELLVAMKNENTIKFWESLGFNHLLTWMYKRN
jgi:ribosomal protein S18 acetylase RimI-like enzyme